MCRIGCWVAGLVVAGRDDARNGRTHLDVLLEVGDHLALHVQLGLGLLDLLGRNASGLVDRQQAVVVVLDGLQLHQLLGVLRGIERHDELPLAHRIAHLDVNPVDVHARSRRSDVVLLVRLDLGGEDLRKLHRSLFGNGAFGQHAFVFRNGGHAFLTRAAGERDGGDAQNHDFFHTFFILFFIYFRVRGRRCGRTRPWPKGNRRSPARSSAAPAFARAARC